MDSCFLCLPDTLSNELISVAQSGFSAGFGVGSACLLAAGLITVVLGIINRSAGS